MPTIQYGTQTIHYKIERKATLKNTYIYVNREGVLVKANKKITQAEIESFVLKKSKWILKHLQSFKTRVEDGELRSGSRLYYLGKSYYVELIQEERRSIDVKFIHSKFIIKAPKSVSQYALHHAINGFYKSKAIDKILPLLKKHSKIMKLYPTHISFRKADKRWGSCSSTDRISLNYYLMKLPIPIIEYVIVHELAHIRHKNHSPDFWNCVRKYMPDYQQRREELKRFEKML